MLKRINNSESVVKKVGEYLMRKQKFAITFLMFLLLLSVLPLSALAQISGNNQVLGQQGGVTSNIWETVRAPLLKFFNFFQGEWLMNNEASRVGFIRFAYFIIIFALFYLGSGWMQQRNARIAIIFTLALVISLFTPPSVLNSIFGSFAAVIGFLGVLLVPALIFTVFALTEPLLTGGVIPEWIVWGFRGVLMVFLFLVVNAIIGYVNAGFKVTP